MVDRVGVFGGAQRVVEMREMWKQAMKQAVLVALLLWLCPFAAKADVYSCTGADGKTVYQQSPCTTGAQKTVDDSNSRFEARQRQILDAQKREEEGDLKLDAEKVRGCLKLEWCKSGTYISLLRGKPRSFVNDTLGAPASVQNIGGREIEYFNVPTTDGRKRARLQISYVRSTIPDPAGVVFGPLVVETVNVY